MERLFSPADEAAILSESDEEFSARVKTLDPKRRLSELTIRDIAKMGERCKRRQEVNQRKTDKTKVVD